MSQNSSANRSTKNKDDHIHHLIHRSGALARPLKKTRKTTKKMPRHRKWQMLLLLPGWVLVSFVGSVLILDGLLWLLRVVGVNPLTHFTPAVVNTALAALTYLLAFAIAFGVPRAFGRGRVNLETLGLSRLMTWTDIGLAPVAFIVYLILAWAIVAGAVVLFPGFSPDQAQDVGFKNLSDRTGYLLAFTTLVVVAPVAEELLFRGYLYGKLKRHVPLYAAILMTSALFAAVHLQWNVALNVFALSIVMCLLRELTGTIWAGILLHMIKNGIAFYILFIASELMPGLGG